MNILCATGIYPPEIGGPATFATMIKKELPLRGHTVRIVTYADARLLEEGVTSVMRALPKGARHIAYFFALVRNMFWADVVVALDPVSAGFPAMWVAHLFRKKFILRLVGDYAWEQGTQRYGVGALLDEFLDKTWSPPVERLRRIEKRVALCARKVIVPSAYLASVVERWGVTKEKIVIVPNSVSAPVLSEKSVARASLGFTDECVVISVGRLVPWKGFASLIDATKNLSIFLVIIGDGPDSTALKERAAGAHNIRFTGALPKDKLAQYLAAADIFALNTGYEGFSHQLIEAMAEGLAIATTDAGGNKEVVKGDENALVVAYNAIDEWKRSIARLAGDSVLRERLGKNAQTTAALYTTKKTVDAFEQVLHSL
ncbi:MAG: glycosyltransferase family 4 protein [Patescibacteria group bacterium]